MAGHLDDNHSWDSCKGRENVPFHDNLLLLVSLFHHLNYTEAQHVVRALVKICTKLKIWIHYGRKTWWVVWRDENLLMLENYWSLLFNLTLNLITLLHFSRIACRTWKCQNTYCTSSSPTPKCWDLYQQLHFSSLPLEIKAQWRQSMTWKIICL